MTDPLEAAIEQELDRAVAAIKAAILSGADLTVAIPAAFDAAYAHLLAEADRLDEQEIIEGRPGAVDPIVGTLIYRKGRS